MFTDISKVIAVSADAVPDVLQKRIRNDVDGAFLVAFTLLLGRSVEFLTGIERGEVEQEVVLKEFHAEVRKGVYTISNVARLRTLFYFPYALLRDGMGLGRDNA